jgi:pimeloyl-ACP methyl ester carboxylesterase
VSWTTDGAAAGSQTQAYLSDAPGGHTYGFWQEGQVQDVGTSTHFVQKFTGLTPYTRYYVTVRVSDGAEWGDLQSPDPDQGETPTIPVVLIHGMLSSPSECWEGLFNFEQHLRDAGVRYVWPVTLPGIGIPNDWDFAQMAQRASSQMVDAAKAVEATSKSLYGQDILIPKVDIVAHSMGGLVGRRLSDDLWLTDGSSTAGISGVRKLVTLGTPHEGSKTCDVVAMLGVGSLVLRLGLPCIYNLATSSVKLFNARYPGAKAEGTAAVGGILYNVVGTRVAPVCGGLLTQFNGTMEPYPNDGWVWLASALPSWNSPIPLVMSLRSCHTDLHENEYVFAWTKDILIGASELEQQLGNRLSRESASGGVGAGADPQWVYTSCRTIAPGDVARDSFLCEGGDLTVGTIGSSSQLSLNLVGPSGAVWDSARSLIDAACTYTRTATGCGLQVKGAEAGWWRIQHVLDGGAAGAQDVCAIAGVKSSVRMTASIEGDTLTVGVPASVQVSLVDGGAPVTGASVSALAMEGQRNTGMTLPLLDDGAHGDGAAGDGVYGGSFTQVNAESVYVFIVNASGHMAGGQPFLRTSILSAAAMSGALTAVLGSLEGVEADAGRVRLTWFTADPQINRATVYRRRSGDGGWAALGEIPRDGSGHLTYEDMQVAAGTRYGYRLGVQQAGGEVFLGETWVDVPKLAEFSLAGATPNPSGQNLTVTFSLPDATPARIEVVDVSGRKVLIREVGALGAGRHAVGLAEGRPLPPGVYLVRLTQGRRSLTTRAVIVK